MADVQLVFWLYEGVRNCGDFLISARPFRGIASAGPGGGRADQRWIERWLV